MEIIEHKIQNMKIAELKSPGHILNNLDGAMQIIGDMYYQGYDAIILNASLITPDFFDLKTKLAGEILQKFSNYRIRLAILGDWRRIRSKNLSDFIRESNSGKLIYFGDTVENTLSHWSH